MGLQSFLTHAQNDPGTQEAIRKLLDGEDSPPERTSPDRMSGVASSSVFAPPVRTIDQPLISPPTYSEPLLTPPTRIDPRQGMSTQGMSPIDAAQARLRVTQQASPQQRIDTTDPNFIEAAPPHGISRLRAAGRLFLDQLKSGHGLIGGLFGLGEGLIAPGHAQDLKHQQEVAEAQGNLDQVLENEKAKGQVADIQAQAAERKRQSQLPPRLEPPHEDFRLTSEGEYGLPAGTRIKRNWNGAKFSDEIVNGKPVVQGLPPTRTPHEPLIRMIKNKDGSETAYQSNDWGETWTPSKLPSSAAPPDRVNQSEEYGTAKTNAERSAKAEAARAEAKQHTDMANALREQEKQARGQVANLWANPVEPSMANNKPYEDWQRRIKEGEALAERLRTQAESSDNKRIEAETRAAEFGKPLPAPPTRAITSGAFKPASDGKYHYTEAQIRANLNGKTYEETVAHLKSLPNVVIDQ